uniref:Uncharacterized protein n=1 Tax=Vitis vinifera TaxID=29760 RepID=A5C8B1_VITVI|nr:hypothetical protein VITISV_005282 [Vitis vinifera]
MGKWSPMMKATEKKGIGRRREMDVRTQAMYQLLDSGFIGLIFSCFSEDAQKVGRIQVIAFQSTDGKQSNMSRPISLSPVHRSSIIDVESSFSSSENAPAKSGPARVESSEQDTGDSRTMALVNKGGGRSSDLGGFFANADANYLGRDKMGGNYHTNNSENAVVDIDPMDMSESMQEAMHRSNLDMRLLLYLLLLQTRYRCPFDPGDIKPLFLKLGAEYVRKEVPLLVFPTLSLLKLDSPLTSFTDLQRVLYEEERAAYNQAIVQNTSLSPAINALQDRLKENEIRTDLLVLKQLAILTDEARSLETEAFKGSESSSGSPRNFQSHGIRGSASLGHRDLYPAESINLRSVAGPGDNAKTSHQVLVVFGVSIAPTIKEQEAHLNDRFVALRKGSLDVEEYGRKLNSDM